MSRFEKVNSRVAVLAGFGHTPEGSVRITPFILRWGRKRFRVQMEGLYHVERRGSRRIHILGFSSGGTAFRVEFDAETAEWTLVEVYYGD